VVIRFEGSGHKIASGQSNLAEKAPSPPQTDSPIVKEIAHTDPEPYFSQSVLLIYGTNDMFQLILDHYRRLCVVSAVLTYRPTCIYNFRAYCV